MSSNQELDSSDNIVNEAESDDVSNSTQQDPDTDDSEETRQRLLKEMMGEMMMKKPTSVGHNQENQLENKTDEVVIKSENKKPVIVIQREEEPVHTESKDQEIREEENISETKDDDTETCSKTDKEISDSATENKLDEGGPSVDIQICPPAEMELKDDDSVKSGKEEVKVNLNVDSSILEGDSISAPEVATENTPPVVTTTANDSIDPGEVNTNTAQQIAVCIPENSAEEKSTENEDDDASQSNNNKTMHVAVSHISPLEVEECTPGLPIPLDSPNEKEKAELELSVEISNGGDFTKNTEEDKENVPTDGKQSPPKRPPMMSPTNQEGGREEKKPVRPPRPPPPKEGFRLRNVCIEDDAELYANREEIIRRGEKNKLKKTMSLGRNPRDFSPIYDDLPNHPESKSATIQGNVSVSGHQKGSRKLSFAGFLNKVKRRFSAREDHSKRSRHDNGYRNDSPIYQNVYRSHHKDFRESNDSMLSLSDGENSKKQSPRLAPKRPMSPPAAGSAVLRRSQTMPTSRDSPRKLFGETAGPTPPCVSFPTTTVISVIYPEPPCPSFPTMSGSPAIPPPVPPCVSFPTTTSSPARPPIPEGDSSPYRKSKNLTPPPRPPSFSPKSNLSRSASAACRFSSPPGRPLSPPPIYDTTTKLSLTKPPVRPARPPSAPYISPMMEIIQEEPSKENAAQNIESDKGESQFTQEKHSESNTHEDEEKSTGSDRKEVSEVSLRVHVTPTLRQSHSLNRPSRPPPPASQEKIVLRKSQTLDRTRPQSERQALSDTSNINTLYPILERLKKRSSMRDEYSWRVAAATSTDDDSAPKSTSFFVTCTGGEDPQLLRHLMEDAIKNFLVAWRNQVSSEMNKIPSYIGHDASNLFLSQAVNGWKGLTVYTNKRTQDRFMFVEEQSPANEIAASRSTFVDLLDAYLNCEARLRPSNTFPADHISTLEDCFDSKLSEISRILLLLNSLLSFQKVAHRLDPGVSLDTQPSNILVVASSWNQLIIFRRRLSSIDDSNQVNDYEVSEKVFLTELKRLHSGYLADMLECAVTVHQAIQRSIQRVFQLIQKEGGVPASVYLMPHLFPSLQPPDMIAYAITRIYAFKTGVE